MKKAAFAFALALALAFIGCAHSQAPQAQNVYFDTGKSDPKADEDYGRISRAVELLKGDGELRLLIVGHTDNQGSAKKNEKLAFRRANAVKAIILEQLPYDEKRITLAWYGQDRPTASNTTDAGRAANRRVQLFYYHPRKGTDDSVLLQAKFDGELKFSTDE